MQEPTDGMKIRGVLIPKFLPMPVPMQIPIFPYCADAYSCADSFFPISYVVIDAHVVI